VTTTGVDPPRDSDPNATAFEQTMRGLERQGDVLDQLRARAGIVLSATGIIASLLGSQALQGRYSVILALIALGSTAAGICLCVSVLWPVHDEDDLPKDGERLPRWNRWPRPEPNRRREWQLTIPRRSVRDLRGNATITDALLDELDLARYANYVTIERRSKAFGWACLILGIQLVLWVTVLLNEPRSAGAKGVAREQPLATSASAARPAHQAPAGARTRFHASARLGAPIVVRITAS